MKQKLRLKLKPLSINSTYYHGSARYGKNTKAQDWTYEAFSEFMYFENREKLKLLRDYFKPEEHAYLVSLTWRFPKSALITKSNTLSSKAHDLSNIEKSIIDILFLPSNYSDNITQGCLNLNIDDKHMLQLNSKKSLSESEDYILEIEIDVVNWRAYLDLKP
jgi:hypothetical protein